MGFLGPFREYVSDYTTIFATISLRAMAANGILFMDKLRILVIEDDKLARDILADSLTGQTVDFAGDKSTAERKLKAGHYDICFIDLSRPV